MIDNSKEIKNLMHFEMEGDVYYLQVMQRVKDGNPRDHVVTEFHIHSIEQFDSLYPSIKSICIANNARAMIRLNQRNTIDANIRTQIECLASQLEVNRVMRKMIRTGDTTLALPKVLSAQKLYSSALGKTCTESTETRKWIIDIDPEMVNPIRPGFETMDAICDTFGKVIVEQCGDRKNTPKVYCRLNSKRGLHLVTSTFRVDQFSKYFGKPSNQNDYIMTDANTNLYIPD